MEQPALKSQVSTSSIHATVSGAMLRIGPFELLLDVNLLQKDGKSLNVGARAIGVLRCLAARPGQTVSKQVLLQEAWIDESGHKLVVETGSLQVQIHNLRKALGRDAIKTVMDRGYQLALPVSAGAAAPIRFLVPNLIEPLIGREDDASTLGQLLSAHRLVTVIGGGGMGKTSLSTNVALGLDVLSTHWIPLAPLSSEDDLVRTIAAAARCEVSMQSAAKVAESLAIAMRGFRGLLVLDNAEHLIDPIRNVVATVLVQAPHARFLITSQVPLRLVGEEVFQLAPLSTPEASATDQDIANAAAVRLFLKVARLRSHEDIDSARLHTIGRITRALGGNPLAIQLVASHAQTLGVDFLAGPIEGMFDLTSVHTSQPLRQRSLTDAFDWSLDLLDEDSRKIFHLLAQFPAGVNSRMLPNIASALGLEVSVAIRAVGELLDRSLAIRSNTNARIVVPEAARHYSLRRTLAEGTQSVFERSFIDIIYRDASESERFFWRSPVPFWRAYAMPEAENTRAAFALAIQREYVDPLAILALGARHAWSEDGRSPTPLSLRAPSTAALIARARTDDVKIFRIFDALSGLHGSVWETIQEMEAKHLNYGERDHEFWLGLAYLGECTATANYDLAHARICRDRAAEHLSSFELMPVVHHFMLAAKGLVAQASNDLQEAQDVFDRRLQLSEECSPGFFGMAITDSLDCAWRRRDYARLRDAWDRFPTEGVRLRRAGQVGVLSIWLLAFSAQRELSSASAAYRRLSEVLKLSSEFEPWVINGFASFALACGDAALAADVMAKGEHLEARSKLHRARLDQQGTADILTQIQPNLLRAARDRTLAVTLNEMLRRCTAHADRVEARNGKP
jgi:predicted ATPase/DNA-binding winged helix-turn-helix (wHTH) protein